jgi:hypothetical protein
MDFSFSVKLHPYLLEPLQLFSHTGSIRPVSYYLLACDTRPVPIQWELSSNGLAVLIIGPKNNMTVQFYLTCDLIGKQVL